MHKRILGVVAFLCALLSTMLTARAAHAAPTTTTVTPVTVMYGQTSSATYQASVNCPGMGSWGASVTFQIGTTVLCTATSMSNSTNPKTVSCTSNTGALASPPSATITAFFTGSGARSCDPSTGTATLTINKRTPSVMLNVGTAETYGSPVNYSATVSKPGMTQVAAANPTGTVTFTNNNVAIPGCVDLPIGTPCTTTGMPRATNTIRAVYNGDANYTSATAGPSNHTVTRATPGITLNTGSATTYGQAVNFVATLTWPAGAAQGPSNTVTFRQGPSNTNIPGCTNIPLIGATATCATANLAAGSYTNITALYNGGGADDTNYNSATSAAGTHTVNKATPSVTVTGTGSTVFGQSASFSATVTKPNAGGTNPTGTVAFQDGGVVIAGCAAVVVGGTCTTTSLPVGTRSITAVYSGDANYETATSLGSSHTVSKANTVTTVTSTTPSVAGNSVTFNATVTAAAPGAGTPTGTVDFLDNGSVLVSDVALGPGGTVSFATNTLSVGSHTISVRYHGNANFNASNAGGTETPHTHVVNAAATAISTSKSPAGSSTYGDNVTVSATVQTSGSPLVATGNVEFWVDGSLAQTIALDSAGQASFSTSTLMAGSHSIVVKYAGHTNHAAATDATVTHDVTKVGSSVTVTSSQNPQVVGENVTFTASITLASGTGTATGSVQFKRNGANLGSPVPLTGSGPTWTAQLTTNALALGDHTITAEYAGDANVNASTGSMTGNPQVIKTAISAIDVVASPDPSTYGEDVSLDVTVTAIPAGHGGPITGSVTVTWGTVTTIPFALVDGHVTIPSSAFSPGLFLAAGSHTITVNYPGDATHDPSSASVTITVEQKATTTTLTSSKTPSVRGESITLTAVCSAAVGSITFSEGTTTLGTVAVDATGTATLVLTNLAVGTHTFVATASGDGNHLPSTSPPLDQVVEKAATTTTVSSSSNPSSPGTSVKLTAVVEVTAPGSGTPTGTVTFMDGATPIGSPQPVSPTGTASIDVTTLTTGDHSITAVYSGDSDFLGSTSAAITQRVDPTAPVVTLSADPNPAPYKAPVTLTAQVTVQQGPEPTGTVTFREGTTTLGTATIDNGKATFQITTVLAPGNHQLSAEFNGSTGSTVLNVVNRATTTTLTQSSVASTPGASVTFTATVTVDGGDPPSPVTVTFLDGETVVAANVTGTGNVATWTTTTLSVGSHAITARFEGATGYNPSTSNMLTHVVNEDGTPPPGEDGGTSTTTPDAGAPQSPTIDAGGNNDGSGIEGGGSDGCGCRVVGSGAGVFGAGSGLTGALALLLGFALRRRRRS